jgi:hypothetical protein
MGTVEQHLNQWQRNRKLATLIDSTYRDWQINIIFYAALHAIDAALIKLGVTVSDHNGRNSAIKSNASLVMARDAYLNLYRICRITRYDPDPDNWIPKQYLTVVDLAEATLKPIKNGITPILSKISYSPLVLKTQ